MEDTDCFTSTHPARCLALLPVAIGLAANPGRFQAENIIEGRFENPDATFWVAGSGTHWTREGRVHSYDDRTRYGSTTCGTRWLLLKANRFDAQTIGRKFTMGATYHLALACADVFGHSGQRLAISVSGGAVAGATYSIPANAICGGELSFVNCGLDFTPVSDRAITIRLAHSTDDEAGGDPSLQTVPLRVTSDPSVWTTMNHGIRASATHRFLPGWR